MAMGLIKENESNGNNEIYDRLNFMKYHPDMPTNKAGINKAINKIKGAMRQNGVPKKDIDLISQSRQDFIKKYAEGVGSKERAGEIFDKSYVSNAIYDVRLNGYGSLENIGKVLKEGYIKNAKAFNKRSQIWFTSGYSSDPEAVIRSIEKVRQGKSEIEND